MNKKLGIILLFVGAYVVLLGGLFWNMSAPEGNCKDYDWVWGVLGGIIIASGAALSIKKNLLAYLGFGLDIGGVVFSILIVFLKGVAVEKYFSPWMFIGSIVAALGTTVAIIFHISDAERVKKYGPTLM